MLQSLRTQWDDCFPSEYEEHQYGLPSSLAAFKRAIAGLRTAFPDFTLSIEATVADGDDLWARMTARGTHLGPFHGFAPTGRSFRITVFDVCRFRDGKIVEHWGVPDRYAVLHQLGLIEGSLPGRA